MRGVRILSAILGKTEEINTRRCDPEVAAAIKTFHRAPACVLHRAAEGDLETALRTALNDGRGIALTACAPGDVAIAGNVFRLHALCRLEGEAEKRTLVAEGTLAPSPRITKAWEIRQAA